MKALRYPCLIAAAAGASCSSTSSDLEGRTIRRVEFEYVGETTVGEDRLRSYLRTAPGVVYSSSVIDEDIRRLFYTGWVDDVQILAAPAGDSEVNLQFKVTTPRPMGVPFGFSGNHAFRDLILIKASELKALPESEADTLKAITRLERFYHQQGYPQARVAVRRTRDQGVTSDLCFEITEGPLR